MRVVVHRVDAPRVARAVMSGLANAKERGIAQVDVGRCHVDLRAQRAGAVRKLAGTHPPEKIQALGGLAVAPRAVAARLGERAAVGADLVGGEVARIGFSRANQRLAKFVELSEIVRRVEEPFLPVEPEPVHVVLDRIHVLGLFLERVRVVEAEVALSSIFAGDAEVQTDRLGMADVKVAVRLGGEARRHAARVLSRASVLVEDLADEVLSGNWRRGFGCVVHGLLSVRQALSRGGPRKPGGAAGWSPCPAPRSARRAGETRERR